MSKRELKSVRFLAFLLLTLCCAGAVGKEPTPPTRLKAEFEMERRLAVLKDSLRSSGVLVLGGAGRLRWETKAPSRSVLIVDGDKAWIHYPDLAVTKSFDIGADPVMKVMSEHLLALSGGDFAKVAELYTVSEAGTGAKKLVPRQESVRQVFRELSVVLTEQGVASRVEIVSKTGDVTVITFRNVKLDDASCATPAQCAAFFQKP